MRPVVYLHPVILVHHHPPLTEGRTQVIVEPRFRILRRQPPVDNGPYMTARRIKNNQYILGDIPGPR